MKKEQAIQIATNFFTYRQGGAPYDMTLKRVEGNKFTFRVSSLSDHETIYEIILDPLYDQIEMKEIIAEYQISDFTAQPTKLSQLKKGDLFRNECDCMVWMYYGYEMNYGQMRHGITRETGGEIFWQSNDATVYPCGK